MSHYTTVETCKVFLQTCSHPIKGWPPRSTSKTTAISLFTAHLCRHVWTLPLFPQTCQQLHLLNRNGTVFSVQRKLLWSLITGKDCETFWKMKRSNKFFIEIHNEFCLIAVNTANMDLTSFNSSRLSCKTLCVTAKARIPRYPRRFHSWARCATGGSCFILIFLPPRWIKSPPLRKITRLIQP